MDEANKKQSVMGNSLKLSGGYKHTQDERWWTHEGGMCIVCLSFCVSLPYKPFQLSQYRTGRAKIPSE